MGKFEIKKSKKNDFYFNLKADNGQVILTSEMYSSKAACENGIESVKKNSPDDLRYERKKSGSNKFSFLLKATNGRVIGKSEQYDSEASREKGIESVKKNGKSAAVAEEK